MPDKHQFTLKWLLVEVVLLGVSFAVLRWGFFTSHGDDSAAEMLLLLFAGLPIGVASFGAAVGGIFGSYRMGAANAVLCVLVFVLLCQLFLPSVQY